MVGIEAEVLDNAGSRSSIRRLTIVLALLCGSMLVSWIPHYLTWPFWPDHDTNSTMALGWSVGLLPYRDFEAFTFPGQMYLFRGLQAVFGPGRTTPFFALDAGLVVLLGGLLAIWSLRRLGGFLPGLIGYAGFLSYYLGLNFSLVAQRDWQAMFFIAVALLLPKTFPGRSGRLGSALATALAFTFRPHVVLFLPALVLAVVESSRKPGRVEAPEPKVSRALLEWTTLFLAFLVLAFSPLIVSGLVGDFVQGVRLAAYGSTYSRATPFGMLAGVIRPLTEPRFLFIPLGIALLYKGVSSETRSEAKIWGLALAGVLLYKPLHPFPHDYLDLPRQLVWAIGLALLVRAVLESAAVGDAIGNRGRLVTLLALLTIAVPAKPEFCNPRASLRAMVQWISGRPSMIAPPGYVHHMTEYQHYLYDWEDYRRTLDYLRDPARPSARVANVLRYQVALNGASGRLSVFENESGLLWITQLDREESEYVDSLLRFQNSLVVWSPGEEGPDSNLRFPRLEAVIRRYYQPIARFGVIQVWERRELPTALESFDRFQRGTVTGQGSKFSVLLPIKSPLPIIFAGQVSRAFGKFAGRYPTLSID